MQTAELYNSYVLPTYARQNVCFVRGEGSYLFDENRKRYLDFASGIGVVSIGHSHPKWVEAVSSQAAKLAHTSNLYYTEPGGKLAEKICELSGLSNSAVFFSNSGAEANEGLIKAARKYSEEKYGKGRHKIVTLTRSFHGRTHTALAASGQDVLKQHFQPLTEGFIHVKPNDFTELESLNNGVCAVLLEAVQGEGGIWPLEPDYAEKLAALCRERDWLLLFDEVQTGFLRTGKWFGYQNFGVEPDGFSFAKGIANGFPIGGFLLSEKLRNTLTAGLHGSTFGGGPLACSAALATLEVLENCASGVNKRGEKLRREIENIGGAAKSVRGLGLMLGISVEGDNKSYIPKLLESGLVALIAGTDAVRLLPPINVSSGEIDEAVEILRSVLQP